LLSLGAASRSVTTEAEGGDLGSVGKVEQGSVGQVGDALRWTGPKGLVEFEVERR
jgi:hypothetical protein